MTMENEATIEVTSCFYGKVKIKIKNIEKVILNEGGGANIIFGKYSDSLKETPEQVQELIEAAQGYQDAATEE